VFVGLEAEVFPFADDVHADEAVRAFQFVHEGNFGEARAPGDDGFLLSGFHRMQQTDAQAVNVGIRKSADATDGVFADLHFWMAVGMAKERGEGAGETGVVRAAVHEHVDEEGAPGQKALDANDDDGLASESGIGIGHKIQDAFSLGFWKTTAGAMLSPRGSFLLSDLMSWLLATT
jgi:hypothetical protein